VPSQNENGTRNYKGKIVFLPSSSKPIVIFATAFSTLCFYPCYFEMNGLFAPAFDVRQMEMD
jgi:hypothetical protein